MEVAIVTSLVSLCTIVLKHGCIIKTWIQSLWQATIHSYEAQRCMKAKLLDFPSLKIPGSEAVPLHNWAHRASAPETILLLCVIRVEPGTSGFPLC